MHSRFDYALSEANAYENTLMILSGAFYTYFIHHQQPLSRKAVKHFAVKGAEIASEQARESVKRLRESMYVLADGARLQAHTDAGAAFPTTSVSIVATNVEDYLVAVYKEAVLEGTRLANKMVSRYALMLSSGLKPEAARVRVMEQHRDDIANLYSIKRLGRRLKPHHAVYLRVLEALGYTERHTYIKAALTMGYEQFYIVEPGAKRDGMTFRFDDVPESEFHPQSKAEITIDLGE